MHKSFFYRVKKKISRKYKDIDPEDIFLDSANLPGFAEHRFHGRMEQPIESGTFLFVRIILVLTLVVFAGKLWALQISDGNTYAEISENNRLEHALIFADRGIIYDRNRIPLATNSVRSEESDFSGRLYAPYRGLSHLVGYLKYPKKDKAGFYYEEEYQGQAGAELVYNDLLKGTNGLKITETDALGDVTSESVIEKPKDGNDLILAADARISDELYRAMEDLAKSNGFTGGAGAIMDVHTGEIIALSSFPEYDRNLVTAGENSSEISRLFKDKSNPFLNRAVGGLYTPGSILKPIVALAALHEGIISPEKQILSTGSISIPNPYNPSNPSIFRDWKAHGWVDMRRAIAVSSDVYFYAVGGGFEDQAGLGITKIDEYLTLFGLTEPTGIDLPSETSGVIPTPAWKKEHFDGDEWRLGDTYITSIGQYGTQITVLEAVRFVAAIANKGSLLRPSILYGGRVPEERVTRKVEFSDYEWRIIHEGMRQAALPGGTAAGLNIPAVEVAAKTGTAELGVTKELVNSWTTGFFPAKNPQYAFAVIMEKGHRTNTVGATYVMRQVLDWMNENAPEYFK